MLELAILGLLQSEPLNGYRLKQQLELFMSGCINANYGAIYPLLRRLETRGAITVVEEKTIKGLNGKIYSITPLGKENWLERMRQHPHESWINARARFMIKFFFFSHLSHEDRIKLIEHRLLVCRLYLEDQYMKKLCSDSYQAVAIERCRKVIEDEIQWLNEQLKWATTQNQSLLDISLL